MEGVERERVEIDMVKLCGPGFGGFDTRLASLQPVELGFTEATMLAADGDVARPSEVASRRAQNVPAADEGDALLESARDNRRIEALEQYDPSILQINAGDVLGRLQPGDGSWESAVPERVAAIIKERRLFLDHAS